MDGVSIAYRDRGRELLAVDGFSLAVPDGSIVAVVGPSGAGKSTLLAAVAGLLRPRAGTITVAGEVVRPGRVGLMPQEDLLLPWLTVLDNAALGLEFAGVPARQARARAAAALAEFGLGAFAKEYPAALSGGMRQRVSFLRTALAGKEVLLLDEPFGSLDALTRAELHMWFLGLWRTFRPTVMLVTHDVEEAAFLADRIAVVSPRPARLVKQVEVPFARPRELSLVGSPQLAKLKAELLRELLSGSPA